MTKTGRKGLWDSWGSQTGKEARRESGVDRGGRERLVTVDEPVGRERSGPCVAMKLSVTPGRVNGVPTPGQHTDEVLGGLLGYDAERLAELRAAKTIG